MEKKQSLKKFFILMATWLATIIAVFAGSIFYDQYQSSEYDVIAGPYIKKVIPEISKWDPAVTKTLMAAEVAATISEEKFAQAMNLFSRLGTLKGIDEPEFENLHVNQKTDFGTQTVIEYNVDAEYEKGDAVINLKLIDRGGSLEIYHFNFSSESLLK